MQRIRIFHVFDQVEMFYRSLIHGIIHFEIVITYLPQGRVAYLNWPHMRWDLL